MCVIFENTIFLAKPDFSHRATFQLFLVSDMNVTALDPKRYDTRSSVETLNSEILTR